MRTHWHGILWGLLLTLALVTAAAARPPEGIDIDVQVGYNGWVQLSSINPVIVDMDNHSADINLSGELVLDYNGVEYVTRLELPTPSKKRFFLYYPADAYTGSLMLRVRTKAYTDQFEVSTSQHTLEAADANVVVLTRPDKHGSLGILNKLPSVRMQRDLYYSTTTGLDTSKAFVAYYDPLEVDASPKFFSRADIIVIGDIDYQQVTPELAETIKACAAGGTSVVFSLGVNGPGLAASALGDLCPLRVTGTEQTEELGSLGSHYGISAVGTPATLAVGQVATGAEIVEWAGKYPAVVRTLRGSGRVTALAFDYTSIPFKQNPAVAPIFIDNALKIEDSVQVKDWFIHPEVISDALEGLAEAKPITPAFVLFFLLAYVVLIGPLNFLILGKLKRRTLVWTTIPVLIIGFSYLGLSTGYVYRGSNNVTATFQELHVYPHSDYIPYQTTMLVFTAERINYDLVVPDKSAFMYPDIPAVIDSIMFSGGGRLRGMSGGKIDNSRQPKVSVSQGKWTSKQYMYQGYLALNADASSEIRSSNDSKIGIDGSFTLDLPFDLSECFLVTPAGGRSALGRLSGQGTYDVSNLQSAGPSLLHSENYIAAEISNLRTWMQNAVRPGLRYRNEALLIGFTEDVEAVADLDRPHTAHNLNMVVVHLPYEVQIPKSGIPRALPAMLTGGAGFSIQTSNQNYRSGATEQSYFIAGEGYIDVTYRIAGRLGGNTTLSLSLVGWQPSNSAAITEFSGWLEAEIWDGKIWRQVRVPSNDPALDIPISDVINANREVTVRFRALDDIVFGIPDSKMW